MCLHYTDIASCVGYFPTLTSLSQVSGWLDVLPLGLPKGTFTWSAHAQLYNILLCLEQALSSVARTRQHHPSSPCPVIVFDGLFDTVKNMHNKEEASQILDIVFEFAVSHSQLLLGAYIPLMSVKVSVTQRKSMAHVLILSSDPGIKQAANK